MNIIVFSKDRAAQLDLFLRSFYKYTKNGDQIKVLYTYTNDDFKKGYDILIDKYINIKFKLETDFKNDLLDLVYLCKHTIFFVDDNIFIRDFNFYDKQQEIFENDSDILCRSLRLNYYLDWSYAARSSIDYVPVFNKDGIYYWKDALGDYGYPMSLDGHIYRTKEILSLLKDLIYTNPNSLEGRMNVNRLKGNKIICYPESKIINTPVNRVQTNNFNYCGCVSAEYLNERFCNGNEIDLEMFDCFVSKACHVEVEFKWVGDG